MKKLGTKQKLLAKKPNSLSGVISVPGDKSISHRAIVLSMIAHETTRIFNFLDSTDTNKSLSAAIKLGIKCKQNDKFLEIRGKGLYGLKPSEQELFLAYR